MHFGSCHLRVKLHTVWCIRMHFGLCHTGGASLDKTALCTLVYVTPLKPMSPGHCALCFISHGYCALLYKSSLYVTPLMAGGVLLPHPSISSSLCNQPGLHCTIIAHRVATFRYLLHQTSCVQVQGLKGLKVRVIVKQQWTSIACGPPRGNAQCASLKMKVQQQQKAFLVIFLCARPSREDRLKVW